MGFVVQWREITYRIISPKHGTFEDDFPIRIWGSWRVSFLMFFFCLLNLDRNPCATKTPLVKPFFCRKTCNLLIFFGRPLTRRTMLNTFFVAQLATPLKSQTRLWRLPIASGATCCEVLHQRLQIAVEHLDLEASVWDLLCWCFECVSCVKCWCKRRRHVINVIVKNVYIYAMFCIYSNIFYFLVYIWHFHICFSFSPVAYPNNKWGRLELRRPQPPTSGLTWENRLFTRWYKAPWGQLFRLVAEWNLWELRTAVFLLTSH